MTLDANSSYLITFKLMYNFIYLMSDGTTGHFDDTTYGGGSKIPVAIVLSQSKRLAAALKDVNGGDAFAWYSINNWRIQNNDRMFTVAQAADMCNDMNGYHYTWDASGSYDGITIKANEPTKYPAFYYAAHYGSELDADLFAKKGIHLTNGLENKRWHLPSMGEWDYFYTALGLGKKSEFREGSGVVISDWTSRLAKAGFDQVGGSLLAINVSTATFYYSSTERDHTPEGGIIGAGTINLFNSQFRRSTVWKITTGVAIKAFIYY